MYSIFPSAAKIGKLKKKKIENSEIQTVQKIFYGTKRFFLLQRNQLQMAVCCPWGKMVAFQGRKILIQIKYTIGLRQRNRLG